ncbi:MAG: Phosphatidylglycerol--prolipoprotein diacylglyceryl transferase [Chlamydiales bacterium]|nr:Phosphatidylglycerol--prolipoprotein diacylglyceryl transferase [Chlamydiales bacterium]MCH9634824.1 Phosphatidylglycerol--prolipoprotein diacylglyceryl transferase [Chlamydiales bacterium]MCH9703769.1 prolipoprotein diacylglyceryl transferase [Chlamydiota bacterium]
MLATLVWDPNRIFFKIPFINYPITWYGCFFAGGFMMAYVILRHIFTYVLTEKGIKDPREESTQLLDRFAIICSFAAVAGARLGYVFFYGWPYFRHHLMDIPKVWEGGLASHGAAVAVLLSLFYFVWRNKKRFPYLSFFLLFDALVIAAGFAAGSIRLGNFVNQEITGLATTMPWGVIFLHPMDNQAGVPLHPVQLYESIFYFSLCVTLYGVWRLRKRELGSGFMSGCFLMIMFAFRFIIEFLKMPQGEVLAADFPLRMGQILSIPFFLLGLFLLIRRRRRAEA